LLPILFLRERTAALHRNGFSLAREIKKTDRDLRLNPQSSKSSSLNTGENKMKSLNQIACLFGHGAASVVVVAMVALGSWAQDSSVTTIQHGPSSFDTEVKNAEVVYVEGNDLVLKLENGRVEHLVVPDSDAFFIDGKTVGVGELKPGTRLTQTITTITTPRYVNTVRTLEGKVWHVNAPKSLILTLPDNTNQVYTVPDHAKFVIDGKTKTVFDLKKGMRVKATIVTDDEHTVIEQTKFAFGKAPATPREDGVLLFLQPTQPDTTLASAEQPAGMLPETATSLPLVGLAGALLLALSLGFRTVRQARSI
jgi:hypothetical protein